MGNEAKEQPQAPDYVVVGEAVRVLKACRDYVKRPGVHTWNPPLLDRIDATVGALKGIAQRLGENPPVAPVRLPEPDGKLETKAPASGPKLSEGLVAGLMVALAEGDYEVCETKDFQDVETGNQGKEIAVQVFGTEANPLPHTFLIMRSIGGKAEGGKILTL